jgi:hypothetical protein
MEDLADDIDQRVNLRRLPSYGPEWDAAIEYGINVAHLEFTPEQRIQQGLNVVGIIHSLQESRFDRSSH